MKPVVIIPARYQSTRLPGKMLLDETGKYLVQHVYEQALKARLPQEVVIATDDERILSAVTSFGARAVLTSASHGTGTQRVAEAAGGLKADIVVNVQGDEPEIAPELIDRLIEVLENEEGENVATAAFRFSDAKRAADPNLVKVVVDNEGRALYFSRSPLPYYQAADDERIYFGHVGVYAYRKEFLLKLTTMEQTPLEAAEKLEQLRVLESGYGIKVIVTEHPHTGIDTREDYDRFVEQWKKRSQQE